MGTKIIKNRGALKKVFLRRIASVSVVAVFVATLIPQFQSVSYSFSYTGTVDMWVVEQNPVTSTFELVHITKTSNMSPSIHTTIGPTGVDIVDLAYNPEDDTLYGIERNTNSIYTINTITGAATFLATLTDSTGSTFARSGSLYFDGLGTGYYSNEFSGEIYTFDPSNINSPPVLWYDNSDPQWSMNACLPVGGAVYLADTAYLLFYCGFTYELRSFELDPSGQVISTAVELDIDPNRIDPNFSIVNQIYGLAFDTQGFLHIVVNGLDQFSNPMGEVYVLSQSVFDGLGLSTFSMLATNNSGMNRNYNSGIISTGLDLASNASPIDENEVETTKEDTPLTGNLLDNATDPDGDTLEITGTLTVDGVTFDLGVPTTIPSGEGEIIVNADGTYTFTPIENFNGTVPAITYTVADPSGATDTSTLDITVTPFNDTPIKATDDTRNVIVGEPIVIDVLTNDTLGLGGVITGIIDPAQLDIVVPITYGQTVVLTSGTTVTLNQDNTLSVLVSSNTTGHEQFDYSISDTLGVQSFGTVYMMMEYDASYNASAGTTVINTVNDAAGSVDAPNTGLQQTGVLLYIIMVTGGVFTSLFGFVLMKKLKQ